MKPLIPERLPTDRLLCERLQPEHESEMARLFLEPRVQRTMWPFERTQTEADIHDALTRQLDLWQHRGLGLWVLRDRATLQCVGRGGLEYTQSPSHPPTLAVEVAWTIAPERWGQGLATELAHAAVDIGFTKLDVHTLVALTLPDNLASRRVMDKAGFLYERDIVHVGLPHVLYRLGRPQWEERSSLGSAGATARVSDDLAASPFNPVP
jgi:RimJ/RimL family protein N-acetyltransferase